MEKEKPDISMRAQYARDLMDQYAPPRPSGVTSQIAAICRVIVTQLEYVETCAKCRKLREEHHTAALFCGTMNGATFTVQSTIVHASVQGDLCSDGGYDCPDCMLHHAPGEQHCGVCEVEPMERGRHPNHSEDSYDTASEGTGQIY